MQYEKTIFLPKEKHNALHALLLSNVCCILISILLFFTYLVFTSLLPNSMEGHPWILWVIPAVLIQCVSVNFINWENRNQRYKSMAVFSFIQVLAVLLSQLYFGYVVNVGVQGLILGRVIGFSVFMSLLIASFLYHDLHLLKQFNYNKILIFANKYKNFPLFSTWTRGINMLSTESPVFILSTFYTAQITGYYSIAMKLCFIPMRFIGSSIGQVFNQTAATIRKEKEKLTHLCISTVNKLFIIGSLPLGILFVYGNEIFLIVLGSDWAESGKITQLLIFWFLFAFIAGPIAHLFSVLEKQKKELYFHASFLVVTVASMFMGIYIFKSHYFVITLMSLSSGAMWLVYLYKVFKYFNIPILKPSLKAITIFLSQILVLSMIKKVIF